jgi:hypothetical protein
MATESHVVQNKGHPWDGREGWSGMDVKADSEAELSRFIAAAERKFWGVWIRDNTGRMTAYLYKPTGASQAWADPVPN